jgi:hypothetical protein
MTSVPKPLKFLRNQYDALKIVYEKIVDKTTKVIKNERQSTSIIHFSDVNSRQFTSIYVNWYW